VSPSLERQHYGITLAVLALAALAYALLQTMVAPALPAIQRELNASTTSVTWVLTVTCSPPRSRRRSSAAWATCSARSACW
jgi:predicted MFS family arabinose efflux permease